MRDIHREEPLAADAHLDPVQNGRGPKPPSPSSLAIQNEEKQALLAALNRLKPAHRQAVILRDWHQLSFADIGHILEDRSAEAAEKLYHRALGKLREALNGGGNTGTDSDLAS